MNMKAAEYGLRLRLQGQLHPSHQIWALKNNFRTASTKTLLGRWYDYSVMARKIGSVTKANRA